MARSTTTPSRASNCSATTDVAAAPGSTRLTVPNPGVGGVVVEHQRRTRRRQPPGQLAEARLARRVEADHQIGCGVRGVRRHQQLEAGQPVERLRHLRRPGEGRLHLAYAELPQTQTEAEHAAQRVAVRVDVTDQQHPAVRRDSPQQRLGRGPVRLGGSRPRPPRRAGRWRCSSPRFPTPRGLLDVGGLVGLVRLVAPRPSRRRPGTAGPRPRTSPGRRAAAPRRRRCGPRRAGRRCA